MAHTRKPRVIPVNHFSAQALHRLKPGPIRALEIRRVFGPARFAVAHDGRELRFTPL